MQPVLCKDTSIPIKIASFAEKMSCILRKFAENRARIGERGGIFLLRIGKMKRWNFEFALF